MSMLNNPASLASSGAAPPRPPRLPRPPNPDPAPRPRPPFLLVVEVATPASENCLANIRDMTPAVQAAPPTGGVACECYKLVQAARRGVGVSCHSGDDDDDARHGVDHKLTRERPRSAVGASRPGNTGYTPAPSRHPRSQELLPSVSQLISQENAARLRHGKNPARLRHGVFSSAPWSRSQLSPTGSDGN